MKAAKIASWTPLEVGDLVLIKGWGSVPVEVTEIETIYKASDNTVTVKHYFDGWCMPLSAVLCRLVDGAQVPLSQSQEKTYCEAMGV